MEQYLLDLPPSLCTTLNDKIEKAELDDVELKSTENPKQFVFTMNGHEYPVSLKSLPCILESHKTFDNQSYYKCGDINQIFRVFDNHAEQEKRDESNDPLLSGLTPPTTNIVKRKFDKTRKYGPFPREQVARVEEDLVKMVSLVTGNQPWEQVEEELVEFQDWMVDANQKGIIIHDEMAFIQRCPQYLDGHSVDKKKPLNSPPLSKSSASRGWTPKHSPLSSRSSSRPVSPNPSLSRLSRAPSPAPSASSVSTTNDHHPMVSSSKPKREIDLDGEEEDNVLEDELENELFGDMDDDHDEESSAVEEEKEVASDAPYAMNPQYQEWKQQHDLKERETSGLRQELADIQAKVEASANIVVKNRLQQSAKNIQEKLAQVQAELDQINTHMHEIMNDL